MYDPQNAFNGRPITPTYPPVLIQSANEQRRNSIPLTIAPHQPVHYSQNRLLNPASRQRKSLSIHNLQGINYDVNPGSELTSRAAESPSLSRSPFYPYPGCLDLSADHVGID